MASLVTVILCSLPFLFCGEVASVDTLPVEHPFQIVCKTKSVTINKKTDYPMELNVVGKVINPEACTLLNTPFHINGSEAVLENECQDKVKLAWLIEVQPASKLITENGTVYQIKCDAGSGELDHAAMRPASIDEVMVNPQAAVLPYLELGFYNQETTTYEDAFPEGVHPIKTMSMGDTVKLIIYHKLNIGSGETSYMLLPKQCQAYPGKGGTSMNIWKEESGTQNSLTCTSDPATIGAFTVKKLKNADVAWADFHPFMFAGHVDEGVYIECDVYICPSIASATPPGVCIRTNIGSENCPTRPNEYVGTRRRRDVGGLGNVNDIRRVTVRAKFDIDFLLSSGSTTAAVSSFKIILMLHGFLMALSANLIP